VTWSWGRGVFVGLFSVIVRILFLDVYKALAPKDFLA